MSTLNLGILAHVDAGKTSLTERLLFDAGIIGEIGRVDDGSTQTDSLALERQRGITIKSAVVSFALDDVTVNLIDTPGHPDFIAEVERVLNVLDGAVLVISAVEGVQAQTRILMRTLRRMRIPTLVFVNKIDRAGADAEGVLRGIVDKLTPSVVRMGSVEGLGTRAPRFRPYDAPDAGFVAGLTEALAEHDDALLAAYVNDEATVPYPRLRRKLAAQTARSLVHPVFFGSAVTGAGIAALSAGIRELLPIVDSASDTDTDTGSAANDKAGAAGTVFKVERGAAGEKVAYVRMFSGAVRIRDRLRFGRSREGRDHEGKVTAIRVFDRGAAVPASSVRAGQIGKLWGLHEVQIGDTLGEGGDRGDDSVLGGQAHFSPPTLETVVVPRRVSDRGALHTALGRLAEQDPLIDLRQDDVRQEIFVSLYGEVQKEVIQETLATEFGLDVEFRQTTTICVERPVGTGAAVELIGQEPNPFLATVGLRVEPAPIGAGVDYRLEKDVLGTMPPAFFKAIEETVHATLRQGIQGWQVADCKVSLTHTGYYPRQSHSHQSFDKSMSSTAGDFRQLTPLVLMEALRQAGTTVYEPMHRFDLEAPADTLGRLLPVLGRLGAVTGTPELRGAVYLLEGDIPAARVHELQQQLPALTRGEGVWESVFDHYQPVRGAVPSRARTDHNPLNRKDYLLQVTRGVQVS